MGRQAMIAAIREFDGRGPATVLTRRVCETLKLPDLRHILRLVELQGTARSEVAALARLVTKAAAEGDAVAKKIIEEGACELATMVGAVATKVEEFKTLPRVPVVVTGGLTDAGAAFMEPLLQALERQAPTTQVQAAILSPVLGAALLAMELLGQPRSAGVVARLAQARRLPPNWALRAADREVTPAPTRTPRVEAGTVAMLDNSVFALRLARPQDLQAIRMLLGVPNAVFGLQLVAEEIATQRIVGAAAQTHSPRMKPLRGPGIAIHVIPPYRRRGIGRMLVEQLAQHALEHASSAGSLCVSKGGTRE